MTGWIIFLSILAVILFVLFMPAVIDFRYEEKSVNVRISYCGFGIFDTSKPKKEKTPEEIKKAEEKKKQKDKKKEEKKAKKEAAKKAKAAKEGKDGTYTVTEKKKRSVKEILGIVRSLLAPVKNGMRRLFKGIRISKLYLDIKVGNFDAYECSLAYGKMCGIVSNTLAFFQSFFTIKADHIDIQPRFGTESTVYTARFRAKISPSAVLAAGFSLGWTYLMQNMKKEK